MSKTTFTKLSLNDIDRSKLRQLFGTSLKQAVMIGLLPAVIIFLLFSSIILFILTYNFFVHKSITLFDLLSAETVAFFLTLPTIPFFLIPKLKDYWHLQKLLLENKKWQVRGTPTNFNEGIAWGEYGASEETMTFKNDIQTVTVELSDKDFAKTGGTFQIEYVFGRGNQALLIELARKKSP